MARISPELQQLANAFGVETSYEDVFHERQVAHLDSLLGVLRLLGADMESPQDAAYALEHRQWELATRSLEPVLVAWDGQASDFDLILPATEARGEVVCTWRTEAGDEFQTSFPDQRTSPASNAKVVCSPGFATRELHTPDGLVAGYHQLTVEASAGRWQSCVISAPTVAFTPTEPGARTWGCFLPLYALRRSGNWGAGDFTDLAQLRGWVRDLGGRIVGTLPLLAAFLDAPCEPSPYAPASRLFWNEFYIDVQRVPELEQCRAARDKLASAGFQSDLDELRETDEVDYRRLMAHKREVLELLAADFRTRQSPRVTEFAKFTRQHPHIQDYAAFRAVCERRREPWLAWPARLRDGELSPADYDPSVAEYHGFVQWIASQQLQHLADQAATVGDGLYLDLPLGVRTDSYDVWRNQQAFVVGASAGAPPDSVYTQGQDWSFPPLHPEGIRRDGYHHLRAYLRHHMQWARMLRIDHVMGLHRLYWIPPGQPASRGVYVRYRPHELYAVLCLESQRNRTTVIGEDLGTVPLEVNQALDRHAIRRMFVVQYEIQPKREPPLTAPPRACIASINTHDMPTFAAWWRGEEIPLRQELGLLSDTAARQAVQELGNTKRRLHAWLRSQGWLAGEEDDAATLAALLQWLAASDAETVLINLEDLWLETRPQNIPSTGPERPNWKRKAALPWQQFTQHPQVLPVLQAVARLRQEPHALTTTAPHQED